MTRAPAGSPLPDVPVDKPQSIGGPTYNTTSNPKFVSPSEAPLYSSQGYTLKEAPGYMKGSGGFQVLGGPGGGSPESDAPTSEPTQGGGGGGGSAHAGGGGGGGGGSSLGMLGSFLLANRMAGGYKPGDIQPVTREVQPEDTVQGQLEGLLSSDSPYMTLARESGQEYAQSRGLLNSSMAGRASEAAAIEAALPIASQDANTYFSQGINNQNTQNRFRENDQRFMQTGTLNVQQALLQSGLNEQQFENQMQLNQQTFGFNMALQQSSLEFQTQAQIERDYRLAVLDVYGTPGLSDQERDNALDVVNNTFGFAPTGAQNFQTIPSAPGF